MSDDLLELKASVLKALGQPTRLKILELLRNGERCVCEIFPAIKTVQRLPPPGAHEVGRDPRFAQAGPDGPLPRP